MPCTPRRSAAGPDGPLDLLVKYYDTASDVGELAALSRALQLGGMLSASDVGAPWTAGMLPSRPAW